jgi:predicted nucleic acid-binding protein
VGVAYVDTSCLVAVTFEEPGSSEVTALLETHDELLASNLLEAELLSALARERVHEEPPFLSAIGWILPDRPLGPEMRRVLAHGYARGADLLHLATALYLVESPAELPFLTLDQRQRTLASALGFPSPSP